MPAFCSFIRNGFRRAFSRAFGDRPEEADFAIRFSTRALVLLILPLVAEQFLGQLMGILDTVMVSSLGDAAVSGVSLVDMIFVLFFNIFGALATGGAVTASRAVGASQPAQARKSASALLWVSAVSSTVLMALVYLLDEEILSLLYGAVEPAVREAALLYMRVTMASFPAVALYQAAAALFRSMGNARIAMQTALWVNLLNVAGNALFIYVFHWGVFGAALATLLGRLVSAVFLLVRLGRPDGVIYVDYRRFFREKPDRGLLRSILSVGLPGSLESGTFQLGRILVLSIISTFGTAQITANAVAGNIDSFGVMTGFACNLAIVTVVGQCMGAGDIRAVRFYAAKVLRLSYLFFVLFNTVLFAVLPLLLRVYSISEEARTLSVILILIHNGFGVLLWTPAFVLPNAMKAVGDAKYVMVTAIASMFVFRVGLSLVLGMHFRMGAVGVWCAMVVDWIVRILCFSIRWKKKLASLEREQQETI